MLDPIGPPRSIDDVINACHWSPAVSISSSWRNLKLQLKQCPFASIYWITFLIISRNYVPLDEPVSLICNQLEEQRHTWAMFRVYRVHGRETNNIRPRQKKKVGREITKGRERNRGGKRDKERKWWLRSYVVRCQFSTVNSASYYRGSGPVFILLFAKTSEYKLNPGCLAELKLHELRGKTTSSAL